MKKLLLLFVMMLTATVAAWADYTVVDGVRYEIVTYTSPEQAYVVAPESGVYTGAVTIPATINYEGNDYAVTQISSGAFENSTITSLTLPVGLKYIFSSFAGTSLTSLTIPGTVTYLTAMGACTSLKSITFTYDGIDGITDEYYWPSGYQKAIELGYDCFTGCTNLTEINVDRPLYRGSGYDAIFAKATKATFGPHATNIPAYCFYWVSLEQLTIGANVTEIETNAFKQATLPAGYAFPFNQIKKIGMEAFYDCKNLPAAVDLSAAEEIGDQAFMSCTDIQSLTIGTCNLSSGAFLYCTNLSSLTLKEGLTDIGDSNFSYLEGLTTVTFPSTLKRIGGYAFQNCTNLTIPSLPEGLEEIGDYAFDHCSKLNVTLPSTLKTIGTGAFSYCESLTEAKIPAGVTYLNPYIFYFCSGLKSVTIPGTVTAMVKTIYYCDNLEEVTFEEGSEPISLNQPLGENSENLKKVYIDRNFEWMSIPSGGGQFGRCPNVIEFGPHVTSIPANALTQQDVKSVVLGANVKSIGATAFYYCRQLEEITIPGSVETIGDECWSDCSNIKKVTFENGTKTLTLGKDIFKDCPFTDLVLDRNYTYATDAPLSNQLERVTFGNHITTIPRYAFKDCTLKNSITMPSSLKEIKYNAFNNCTVPAITLNEGLETIGQSAFQKCTATFNGVPSTVKSIEQSAFSGCTGLTGALVLPAGLNMGLYAFFNCTGLTSLTVPGSIKSLPNAFEHCENITEVTIEYGEEPISIHKACFNYVPCTNVYIDRNFTWNETGSSSFYGFKKTENIEFGSHVTALPNKALYSSSTLANVTMTDNVTSIGNQAFYRANVKGLKLSKNIESIGQEAFQNATFDNSFTFPNAVNAIGDVSFYSTSLKDVYVPWLTPLALEDDSKSWTIGRFSYADDQTLWVPGGTMDAYKDATVWKKFQKFDYWSFVVNASVTGKGTLALTNGEEVTDNGTNTDKSVTGNALVEAGASEPVSGLFVREKDVTFTTTPARGYELSALTANGADIKEASKVENLLADQTISATFTPIIYNITYNNLQNGVVDPANPATYTVEDAAITLVNPTRTGYNFKGWTGTDLEGAVMEVTIATSSIGDREYTATWEPIVYDITYDLAGGAVDPANKDKYTIETADFTLTNPTKTGYTFTGWTGTGLDGKTMTVTVTTGHWGNRSYTATWEPNPYKVHFEANGGDGGTMTDQNFVYDTAQNLTENAFTRTGYIFTGWNSKADGTGTPYADKAEVVNLTATRDAVVTMYAQWTPIIYYVAFDKNGGTGTDMMVQKFIYDTAQELFENAYTRKGYNFDGWNSKANGSGTPYTDKQSVKNLSATQDDMVTLYAQWQIITYTIGYDLAGGTVATANPTEYTVETATFTLTNPTRKGYNFDGWTGTGLSTPTKTVTIEKGSIENRTYTANWTPINYTITYDLAGGEVATANPEEYTIETATFTLNNPTRTGYTFKGWTGTGLDGATMTVTIAKGSTGNREYTATWERNAITLVDDADNSDLLTTWNGIVTDVTLSGRTFSKNGQWNTICLPFDLTIEGSVLAGAEVRTLSSTSINGQNLTMSFSEPVTEIEAGKPYVIRWTSGSALVNPKFEGVTVKNVKNSVMTGDVEFIGTYAPTALTKDDVTNLYLGSNNTLYYPNVDNFKVNAFRAYFKVSDSAAAMGYSIIADFGSGSTTRIQNAVDAESELDSWYTLNGVKLDSKPTQKGVFIHNGTKVVIK